jgi:UDP-N-acetylglucosamine 2-epimerase
MLAALPAAEERAAGVLAEHGVAEGAYYLATVHRPANTDDPATLGRLIEAFGRLDAPVVLPLHPRTRDALAAAGIVPPASVSAGDPVGYLEMLALESNARAILTDSGGVQREAYFLARPCVTLREESEWPETLVDGWNLLAGSDGEKIVAAARRPRPGSQPRPVFGDGRAASKIVEILEA